MSAVFFLNNLPLASHIATRCCHICLPGEYTQNINAFIVNPNPFYTCLCVCTWLAPESRQHEISTGSIWKLLLRGNCWLGGWQKKNKAISKSKRTKSYMQQFKYKPPTRHTDIQAHRHTYKVVLTYSWKLEISSRRGNNILPLPLKKIYAYVYSRPTPFSPI